MWRWSTLVVLAACSVNVPIAPQELRLEPDAVTFDVDLGQAPPAAELHVFAGDRDVTTDATFVLAGAPLATLNGATLTSNGITGGEATLIVAYEGAHVRVPVTAHVRGCRLAGVDASAADAFAYGPRVVVDAQLEPGDGAMLPPNLGQLDVDFTADDADTLHEIAIRSPWLDVRVYTAGAPGPRHVELTRGEWAAIASTARGAQVELDVASTATGAPIHVASAHVAVGELDAGALAFTAAVPGEQPRLWRYDPVRASVDAVATLDTCFGCHVAVSPDGKRLASGANGSLVGYLFDLPSQSIVARTTEVGQWTGATFSTRGELITTFDGVMTLRDAATGAAIAPIPTATPAAEPAVSPDGQRLAYVSLETVPVAFLTGDALELVTRDPATGAFGAPRELARGDAILEPEVASDGRWVIYTRNVSSDAFQFETTAVVSTDGATTYQITSGALDGLARWASPIVEDRAWIALRSTRSLGGIPQQQHLWLAAIDLATGTVSRPIHLPGQHRAWGVMHAAMRVP